MKGEGVEARHVPVERSQQVFIVVARRAELHERAFVDVHDETASKRSHAQGVAAQWRRATWNHGKLFGEPMRDSRQRACRSAACRLPQPVTEF